MKAKCCYCGKAFEMKTGYYNRAMSIGANIYCSRKHSGMARRQNVPIWLKKKEKAEYDKEYRAKNEKRLKKKRHAWFIKDYAANPEKYKKERRRRQKEHNEYCRQPEYRKYKKEYDKKRVAKKNYGKLWEAAIALHQLADIVDNRRAKQESNIINKSQKRKRNANKNTKRQELEKCVMGLYQPS